MFDTHVHFDVEPFLDELDDNAARTLAAGVAGALNPAIHLASSLRALRVNRAHPWILPAIGVHPLYIDAGPVDEGAVARTLAAGRFSAVGEVGLDFWRGREDEERQREVLHTFAALAKRENLPLLVHSRKALYDTLTVIKHAGFGGAGVLHAFSGSWDMAAKGLDQGFYISAAANITYPRKAALREVFARLPRERVVVETDAPDIPPWEKKGEVHNPWDLPIVVRALAEIWGVSAGETARITEENARKLFDVT